MKAICYYSHMRPPESPPAKAACLLAFALRVIQTTAGRPFTRRLIPITTDHPLSRRLICSAIGLALLVPISSTATEPDTASTQPAAPASTQDDSAFTHQWARVDAPSLTKKWMFETGG